MILTPPPSYPCVFFFFFNDTATTEIYTLSLHDALPIFCLPDRAAPDSAMGDGRAARPTAHAGGLAGAEHADLDRKSTRLNSSHANISYAVFCLKKKNGKIRTHGFMMVLKTNSRSRYCCS